MKPLTKTQIKNAKILRSHLERSSLPIPLQIGIMCVIGKESQFKLTRESSYRNTSNERLRKLFSRVRDMSDDEIDFAKTKDIIFFNIIYGGKLGNRPGSVDGWNYRGGGFNQITGRTMHLKYSDLRDPENAARACVDYFVERIDSPRIEQRYGCPEYWDDETGILIAANINAGLGYGENHTVVQRAFKHAMQWYDAVLEIYWED